MWYASVSFDSTLSIRVARKVLPDTVRSGNTGLLVELMHVGRKGDKHQFHKVFTLALIILRLYASPIRRDRFWQ